MYRHSSIEKRQPSETARFPSYWQGVSRHQRNEDLSWKSLLCRMVLMDSRVVVPLLSLLAVSSESSLDVPSTERILSIADEISLF